jgi:hypothetical protein
LGEGAQQVVLVEVRHLQVVTHHLEVVSRQKMTLVETHQAELMCPQSMLKSWTRLKTTQFETGNDELC